LLGEAFALLECIKKAAVDAVKNEKPVEVTVGRVVSTAPLRIQVSQKLILEGDQLILTDAVQDFTVDMTVEHQTEDETAHTHAVQDTYTGGGTTSPTNHRHAYTGRKRFTVHLGLAMGERVVLQRLQGGQRYIVLNRIRSEV